MAHMTRDEARALLDEAERRRRQVTAEIGMPHWYFWGLAMAWVGLGLVVDVANPWVTAAATFLFGAVHAAVYGVVMGGRRRTGQLRVHTDIVGRHGPWLVLAALVGLGGLTVIAALAARADGAGHPVTLAAVLAAVLIVLGGPRLMAEVRRRADRDPAR